MFLLCLLAGFGYELLIVFFSIIFHELSHVVASKIFKKKVHRITILPFGGIFEVKDNQNVSLLEEFIIILAGPVGSFFLLQFESLYQINIIILLFNILPIYPLDGGRLLETTLCRFIKFRTVLRVVFITSLLSSSLLLYYGTVNNSINIVLISVVLLYINYQNLKNVEIKYWTFLNDKVLFKRQLPIKSHDNVNLKNIYRGFNNIFMDNGKIVTENQLIKSLNFKDYMI